MIHVCDMALQIYSFAIIPSLLDFEFQSIQWPTFLPSICPAASASSARSHASFAWTAGASMTVITQISHDTLVKYD